MESSNSKLKGRFISLSDFSSCVHRLTLKFKNSSLEKEYPIKSVHPFTATISFKVFLYTLVGIIGLRRFLLLILSFFHHSLLTGTTYEEILNFSFFAAAVLLEITVFFVKRFRVVRGVFIMIFLYTSIPFTSYYINRTSLFSSTM